VSLVDLRKTPIEGVTRSGIKTAAGEHNLDILVLATGFDAVTGGLTSIDIRGTGGQILKEKWEKGVQAHLGMAAAGFPNLLFVYGPQRPNAFANGPTCAELQGDWITQMLDHLRQRNWARFEATVPAEEAWRAQVIEMASGTLFPRADSWYLGANIPGNSAGAPLVFNQHFTGTMDHWDPAVTDGFAKDREVILFNNAGVSSSSGEVPTRIEKMGTNAVAFIKALRLTKVDVLGFSIGGLWRRKSPFRRPTS
jgi:cation diffusion facilitator CzcD-associated flavoprotein CzcO